MRIRTSKRLIAAMMVFAIAGVANAALERNEFLSRSGEGLSIAEAGVGLQGLGDGIAVLTIALPGPVEAAVLYWAGRDRPCPEEGDGLCQIPFEPYLDQELLFNGNSIVGMLVGQEQNADINNIAYRANVTEIVQNAGTGTVNFSIENGNGSSDFWRFNGAGLFVLYTDETDPTFYEVTVYDGLDFAYGQSVPFPSDDVFTAEPITFDYGPSEEQRTPELVIFAGDAELERPDQIAVSDNGTIDNQLVSADGVSFDTLRVFVVIPPGTSTTTVELISPGNASQLIPEVLQPNAGLSGLSSLSLKNDPFAPAGNDSDSLLWTVGALRVPVPGPGIDIRKQAEGADARTFVSGSDVTFEIVVTNTGLLDLQGVQVSDPMSPECVTFIGDLAAGDSFTYECSISNVTHSFENEACVEGETRDGDSVDDCDPSTVEIIDIDIRKQEEGPDSRNFPSGSDVDFEVVVTNTGDEDLENVVVVDDTDPACNRDIGFLAAGDSFSYTCTAENVTENVTCEDCVTGERNGVVVSDCDPSTVIVDPAGECDLSVHYTCQVLSSPGGAECEAKVAATLLRYIGPTRTGVDVQFMGSADGAMNYTDVDLISGVTILSDPSQNGWTVDGAPDDLGSKMTVYIDGEPELHHTSCSTPYVAGQPAPLNEPKGDPSPNWFVESFRDKLGAVVGQPGPQAPATECFASPGSEVLYEYVITNNGDSLTGVNVVDDPLGPIAGPFDLPSGATESFMRQVTIFDTTMSTVYVTGHLPDGSPCKDHASVKVHVDGDDEDEDEDEDSDESPDDESTDDPSDDESDDDPSDDPSDDDESGDDDSDDDAPSDDDDSDEDSDHLW